METKLILDMDNKTEFKNFLHGLLALVLVAVSIIAGAGSISFGVSSKETIYIITGILNLGWVYPVVRQLVKYIRKHIDS